MCQGGPALRAWPGRKDRLHRPAAALAECPARSSVKVGWTDFAAIEQIAGRRGAQSGVFPRTHPRTSKGISVNHHVDVLAGEQSQALGQGEFDPQA